MNARRSLTAVVCVLAIAGWTAACGTADGASQSADAQSARPGDTASTPRPPNGMAWIVNGTDTISVEVARTPDERAQGLMDRDSVPDGSGMIFVFPDEAIRSFWMQNTPAPLDIAYINAQMVIIDIQQMEPFTQDLHSSSAPAMFALEVRQGWFAENEWTVGAQLQIVFPDM